MTWAHKLAYGSGSLGNNLVLGFVSTFLAVFYTDVFGVGAAAVGTLFLVCRLVDAVFDPVMGFVVDHTRTRWGRFRPYLLVSPVVLAVITVLLVAAPDVTPATKLIYCYVTYLLWGFAFTTMDVPYWSMSATLTQDAQERTSVIMVPRTLATLGQIVATVATLPLVALFSIRSDLQGWQLAAVFYAVLAVGLTWVTFFTTRERIAAPTTAYTPREMWTVFAANRPLQLALVGMLVSELCFVARTVLPTYYMKYNFGNEGLQPALVGSFAIMTVIGSLLTPAVSRRLGKRATAIWSIVASAVVGVAAWLVGYGSLLPILVLVGLLGFFYGFTNIATMSMITDTVEYGQAVTGQRTEGLVFSLNIFKSKLAMAGGGALAMYGLGLFGYRANEVQSAGTLDGIHMMMTLIPSLVSLLAIWPLARYRLTEEEYARVLTRLEADGAASQSAGLAASPADAAASFADGVTSPSPADARSFPPGADSSSGAADAPPFGTPPPADEVRGS